MRFIELFAGIGGFRLGLERQGHKCVWANEWLEKPRGNYEYNFGERPDPRDIRTIPSSDVPDAELITGGFPCATFSVAGKRTGFGIEDTRGTLCFEMFRIAHEGNIPYILFENVKGLLNHDNGRTLRIILCSLDELGYDCQWDVLDSQYFGVPQHRERVFLIGHLRGKPRPQVFPIRETNSTHDCNREEEQRKGEGLQAQISSTLDAHYWKGGGGAGRNYVVEPVSSTLCSRLYGGDTNNPYIVEQWRRGYFREYCQEGVPTLTANMGTGGHNVPFIKPCLTPNRVDKRQNGRRFKEDGEPAFTLGVQDRHGISIETNNTTHIRKLTPLECERLQGLPDDFTKYRIQNGKVIINPDAERYERCGRTVTIPVIEAIGKRLHKFYS